MQRIVVGAAIVRRGTVLAAQRAHPPELAGCWELPGGKVEAGEDEPTALARECREELGCDIVVGARIGPDLPTADGELLLRVYAAELTDRSPLPQAREHRALRWVGAEQVARLQWLDADLPMVAHLEELLRGRASPLALGVTDLDLAEEQPVPRRPRRRLVRPLDKRVAVIAGLLAILGLTQSAVVASGAAEPVTRVDELTRLTSALFPPPFPDDNPSVTLVPDGVLPAASTCRPSGLLLAGATLVEAQVGRATDEGDNGSSDVLLLRYRDPATARHSLDGVRHAIGRECQTLHPAALDGGTTNAYYARPVSRPHGFEVTYSGGGSFSPLLDDSTRGGLQYSVTGDVALLQDGPYVVEVADGGTVYGLDDVVRPPARHPVPLATVLLRRLVHGR